MSAQREEFIEEMQAKGWTRERCEAFLDVLGSGLTKRGLPGGRVLSDEETAAKAEIVVNAHRRPVVTQDEEQR